jgi:ABC-2 type transport system ATP-binding protein
VVASAGLTTRRAGTEVTITLDADVDPARLAAEVNRRAHAAGIALVELHHQRADLEARYLDLIRTRTTTTGGPR